MKNHNNLTIWQASYLVLNFSRWSSWVAVNLCQAIPSCNTKLVKPGSAGRAAQYQHCHCTSSPMYRVCLWMCRGNGRVIQETWLLLIKHFSVVFPLPWSLNPRNCLGHELPVLQWSVRSRWHIKHMECWVDIPGSLHWWCSSRLSCYPLAVLLIEIWWDVIATAGMMSAGRSEHMVFAGVGLTLLL